MMRLGAVVAATAFVLSCNTAGGGALAAQQELLRHEQGVEHEASLASEEQNKRRAQGFVQYEFDYGARHNDYDDNYYEEEEEDDGYSDDPYVDDYYSTSSGGGYSNGYGTKSGKSGKSGSYGGYGSKSGKSGSYGGYGTKSGKSGSYGGYGSKSGKSGSYGGYGSKSGKSGSYGSKGSSSSGSPYSCDYAPEHYPTCDYDSDYGEYYCEDPYLTCQQRCLPALCEVIRHGPPKYKDGYAVEPSKTYVAVGDICMWPEYAGSRFEPHVCCKPKETARHTPPECTTCGSCYYPQKVSSACCAYYPGHGSGKGKGGTGEKEVDGNGDKDNGDDLDYRWGGYYDYCDEHHDCCKCGEYDFKCIPKGYYCDEYTCGDMERPLPEPEPEPEPKPEKPGYRPPHKPGPYYSKPSPYYSKPSPYYSKPSPYYSKSGKSGSKGYYSKSGKSGSKGYYSKGSKSKGYYSKSSKSKGYPKPYPYYPPPKPKPKPKPKPHPMPTRRPETVITPAPSPEPETVTTPAPIPATVTTPAPTVPALDCIPLEGVGCLDGVRPNPESGGPNPNRCCEPEHFCDPEEKCVECLHSGGIGCNSNDSDACCGVELQCALNSGRSGGRAEALAHNSLPENARFASDQCCVKNAMMGCTVTGEGESAVGNDEECCNYAFGYVCNAEFAINAEGTQTGMIGKCCIPRGEPIPENAGGQMLYNHCCYPTVAAENPTVCNGPS